VEREADGFGLALEKFAADAVHGDAVVGFRHRVRRTDAELLLLEQRVQRHSAVLPPLQQKRMGSRRHQDDQQASFVHLDGKW